MKAIIGITRWDESKTELLDLARRIEQVNDCPPRITA